MHNHVSLSCELICVLLLIQIPAEIAIYDTIPSARDSVTLADNPAYVSLDHYQKPKSNLPKKWEAVIIEIDTALP